MVHTEVPRSRIYKPEVSMYKPEFRRAGLAVLAQTPFSETQGCSVCGQESGACLHLLRVLALLWFPVD